MAEYVYFDFATCDTKQQFRIVYCIYTEASERTKAFFRRFITSRNQGTLQEQFAYTGSPIYAAAQSYFMAGSLARTGIKEPLPVGHKEYPYKTPRIGSDGPPITQGHLCLVAADRNFMSQELLFCTANCNSFRRNLIIIGRIAESSLPCLTQLAVTLNPQMLRPQTRAYIAGCGLCSSLQQAGSARIVLAVCIDTVYEKEQRKAKLLEQRLEQWNAMFTSCIAGAHPLPKSVFVR